MEIDLEDIGDTREFYGDSQLTYMGTYNGLPIVWKPSEQTDEENLVSNLFAQVSIEQDDLNSTLGKQGFQLASAKPQDLCSYVLLTGGKSPGKNGPHKNGEGGYSSGGATLGTLIIIGGLFTSIINPAAGVKMIEFGAGLIVAGEGVELIEKHGKK